MSSTLTSTTARLSRLFGAVVLTAAAATALTTGPAQAEPACKLWVLTDKVDRQARVYGAGGSNGCIGGHAASYLDVDLYLDTRHVAHKRIGPCGRVRCATSTGSIAMPRGSHSWCSIVKVHTILGSHTDVETKSHCIVTTS
ncbi:MAG TPA: hypothetical protein VFV66_18650 [Nonomuraea sp.]|nr:hypothetical protein [Nonomuraea sp.]